MNLFRCTVIVMLCARLFAADPATSSLPARGIDALDAVMKRYAEKDRFPGVMLMVAREGKVAYWMLANKGELEGVRLLRASTVEMMTKPQVPVTLPGVEERLGKGKTFGFGCTVVTDIAAAGGTMGCTTSPAREICSPGPIGRAASWRSHGRRRSRFRCTRSLMTCGGRWRGPLGRSGEFPGVSNGIVRTSA